LEDAETWHQIQLAQAKKKKKEPLFVELKIVDFCPGTFRNAIAKK
jgi:hypothetical protein